MELCIVGTEKKHFGIVNSAEKLMQMKRSLLSDYVKLLQYEVFPDSQNDVKMSYAWSSGQKR